MRKYLLTVVLSLMLCCGANAQSELAKMLMSVTTQPLVLADIEAQVITPASKYFYPVLYERYEKNDTTLTLDDYRYLYYGYMFQAEYEPHKETSYVDSLSNILAADGAIFLDKSTSTYISYIEKILEDRPFSLKFINMMVYLYKEKVRDEEKAYYYSRKFDMILSAIFSTGSGKSQKSPWYVLYRGDAQSVLYFIGADVSKRIYITASIEYYHLTQRQGDVRGYYFNFDPIYTRPNEPKGKRKMELNPMYNPKSDKYINTKK